MHSVENRLRALLIAAMDGDAVAYQTFLTELTRHLRGFLRKRIPQLSEDVEDLVQEILLAVHNGRHTYRPSEPLTAWIHAIARYKLMDFFRARARRESLNDPIDDHIDIFAVSDDEPAQARRDVGRLLDQLPDKQRLPIMHVKLEGLSVAETARLTGLSESAVKVGVHRGLKALAAKLRAPA
ncbi:sigma-70 family RNA polymerase sigma factor [Trinickia caryophylli]|uniref:RNA polymerase sigma-70 factor, ECF subfamily n=1 Tax=Trinickia caryophylli TaxID=28094 RepID=A0A1X7F992_TRICW|nr:sigma-70 family RNA polymerase sigma factor [Trinickia caryophylli]WQE10219.1 sigma-70 family RNA polymerase sigma factor [Trinickia caryophylli]GLU34339.1 RNA polymerase sigma factor [Trinickia caryophylli]SMF48102.1 RNA polymerase sigma-70 factor, ECF subfamily [Trinickia caryophylli]